MPYGIHFFSSTGHPDSKANMGPSWGLQGPGGPHVGPMDFAIWAVMYLNINLLSSLQTTENTIQNINIEKRHVMDNVE